MDKQAASSKLFWTTSPLPNPGFGKESRFLVHHAAMRMVKKYRCVQPNRHGGAFSSLICKLLGCPAGSDRNDRDRKLGYFTYLRDVFTTYLYRGELIH